jgi:hypothetical protein
MAHFAQLDENNVVLQVIVVSNDDCKDAEGNESEVVGQAFCANLFGGNWKQTSYNATIRKNYAGIGYVFDSTRDAFIAPQPFASWTLNESTCKWQSPVPYPSDGKPYQWDESALNWVEIPS